MIKVSSTAKIKKNKENREKFDALVAKIHSVILSLPSNLSLTEKLILEQQLKKVWCSLTVFKNIPKKLMIIGRLKRLGNLQINEAYRNNCEKLRGEKHERKHRKASC